MIASVGKGGGAGGAVAYALDEKKERGKEAQLVANSTSGRTGREIIQEFEAVQALRPDVERRTFFASLAAAPGEHLSNAQWGEVVRGFAEHMGYGRGPYVAVVHRETAHEHVHLIASRVGVDGKLVSDSHDYYKAQAYAREVERTYQLERVASSWERGAERAERQPSREALGRFERTGDEPMMLAVRRIAGDDFQRARTWEELAARLDGHGLRIERGARGAGLVVTDGAESIKASDVGRAYSRGNLEQRLGSYDQFIERQQQRRDEPARLIERPVEQQRGDAGRIQGRYAAERHPEVAVPGADRDQGPGAGRGAERPGGPARGPDDRGPAASRAAARGDADVGRGGAGGGPGDAERGAGVHRGGGAVGERTAGLQGAGGPAGPGEGGGPAARGDRAQLGGATSLPDMGGRDGAGARGVAPARGPGVGEVGDRGHAADDRGAARGGADRRPGDPALPGPANPGVAALRDRGGDGLAAPGAGALPADRAGIERALTEARQQLGRHSTADRAAQVHADAWARLYRDPAGARAQVEAMQRSAPEVAADVLRRSPQTFGRLTDDAAQQLARGWGRDLTDAIGKTGQAAREAEALRPRTPGDQLTAQVARLDGLLEPFRVQDRAQERARELAKELTRGLDRGGRSR